MVPEISGIENLSYSALALIGEYETIEMAKILATTIVGITILFFEILTK